MTSLNPTTSFSSLRASSVKIRWLVEGPAAHGTGKWMEEGEDEPTPSEEVREEEKETEKGH